MASQMKGLLILMIVARSRALINITRLRKAETLLKIAKQFSALRNTRKCRLAKENTTSHITTVYTDSKTKCSLLLEEVLLSLASKVNARILNQMSQPWENERKRMPRRRKRMILRRSTRMGLMAKNWNLALSFPTSKLLAKYLLSL
jgi:hypothetical protein